jgi:pilus assembly protein CpaE
MTTSLKTIGLFISEETRDTVTATLARLEGVELVSHLPEDGWSLASIGKDEMPDLLIYEIHGDKENELDALETLIAQYKEKFTIFVTYADGDISTIRRLMRAGIKDVFPQPIQTADLIQSTTIAITEKRKRIQSALGGKGGVTSFINAKGGTGASTIAVNVAHMLAKKYGADVCLIDLDIQFGSVALQLDLHPTSTVLEALVQPERIDPVFVRALAIKHESGLDVLASPSDLSPIDDIEGPAVTRLLAAAAELYDYVIVDVPRIYNEWVVAALKFSDPVMLVCQNNLSTVRDAKLLLDRLAHDGISFANMELINNRAMSKGSSVTIDKLKDTLGKDKLRRVRNDFKTASHAQDQGRPVLEVDKASHLTHDIDAIAKYIIEQHSRGETKPKHGLFARLFSH